MGVYLLGAILLVFSCDDKLDVQQVYLFTVTTMPVQKRIKIGETAEIRCQLHWEGYYEETKYFIRYFQPDGKERCAWRTKPFFFQMIYTRFRVKHSDCTILLHLPTNSKLMFISKIVSGRWYSLHLLLIMRITSVPLKLGLIKN